MIVGAVLGASALCESFHASGVAPCHRKRANNCCAGASGVHGVHMRAGRALLATRHVEWRAAQQILLRDARATRVRPQGALHNCRAGAPRGALCVGVVLWASGAERGCWAPPQARFLKHGHPKFQV